MALTQNVAEQLAAAYGSGDLGTVNEILQSGQITAGDVQSFFNLSPESVASFGLSFYSPPAVSNAGALATVESNQAASQDPYTKQAIATRAAESTGATTQAAADTATQSRIIKDYVTTVLSSDLTDAEKAAKINEAAAINRVTNEQIAAATGFTLDQVNAYLGAPVTTGATTTDTAATSVTNTYFQANPDVAAEYERSGASELMTPEEFAAQHWQNNGRYEGRTGPAGEAPNAADKIYDHRGTAYDPSQILALANELASVADRSNIAGGVLGTKGQSVGFDYREAKRILGRDLTAFEQVLMDSARQLIDQGITSLSQLKTQDIGKADVSVNRMYDEFGNILGNGITYYDFNTGQMVSRALTPEEEAQIKTEQVVGGGEEGTYTRSYLDDFVSTGKVLIGPDGRVLNQTFVSEGEGGTTYSGPLSLFAGETSTGKGSTIYNLSFGEDGKPRFTTSAEQGAFRDFLQGIAFVGQFIPGFQPFAMAINAVQAAEAGNVLGALASLAGAGGSFLGNATLTNISTGLRVAEAAKNGDVGALVSTLAANPTISNMAGNTMLTDTISLRDVGSAVQLVDGLSKGNYGAALTAAGSLTGNSDFRVAGAALNIITELRKDNPNLSNVMASVTAINNITNNAASNVDANKAAELATAVTNSTASDITNAANTTDLASATYVGAINAGMSSAEAFELANVVANNAVGTADTSGGVITTSVTQSDVQGTDLGLINTNEAKPEIMGGVAAVDTEFGNLEGAISDATARNTLNISNSDANSLEEAAAMAGARGFGNFTYGGKTYSMSATSREVAAQATAADIAAAKNFSEAYSIARQQLGAGQIFEWNGKKYSTDTREENPSLAAASDQARYAQLGAGAGRGSYAGYDAKAAADSWAKINTNVLDTATPMADTFGTMDDFLKAGGLMGDYVVVGDAVGKGLIDPVVKTIGTVTRAGGSFLDNLAGGLQAINVIDKDSAIVRIAKDMKDWGEGRMGDYLISAEKKVMDRVSKAEGFGNKFIELGKALWDNPSAIITLGANEVLEEGVPLLVGAGAAKMGSKLLALGADAFMNAWEAGGANYNDTKAAATKAGMSDADAHAAAQKSAAGAGAVASVLGPLADMPWIKRATSPAGTAAESSTKVVGKATAKETATEYPEEALASVMSDYFATGTVDLNKAMTSGTVGSVVAGKAVGTITVVSEVSRSGDATTEIINSASTSPEQVNTLTSAINSSMQPGADLKVVGADIVTAMEASGMNNAQAINVANTAVAEQVVANLGADGGLKIDDLNIAIGTDKSGNAVTLGDFIGSSVTGMGGQMYVSPDIYIGTSADGKALTVGDLSNLSSAGTMAASAQTGTSDTETVSRDGVTTSVTSDAATGDTTTTRNDTVAGTQTKTVTNEITGVTSTTQTGGNTNTQTVVDSNSGVTTQTQTDNQTGATTNTVLDTTTGVNTKVTTSANTKTETTTDTNTNVTTQRSTDANNNTETTTQTNANTNVTTQTTVNNNTNTTTTVTTNSNGQVTTQTTVDNNTNTETTIQTDVNTNTSTTVVVDLNTNTIISTTTEENVEIKTLDPLSPVDIIPVDETPTDTTPTDTTVTTTGDKKKKEEGKKKPSVKLPAGAGSMFAMMGGTGPRTGLDPQMLRSYVTGEKKLDPLERVREIQEEMEREAMIQNIDPRLASILKDRMGGQQEDMSGLGTLARVLSGQSFDPVKAQESEKEGAYFAYGKEDSIDDILSSSLNEPRMYADGGYVEPLMAKGGMTLPLLAKSGGLPKMAAGREDFRDGKHVAGEGDGQSDDIPAMLADGEFVFPADVVSALGNGSSKAGTDKLYEMMHEIRARARSTGKKDLPPPALKSPLDYLKSKR